MTGNEDFFADGDNLFCRICVKAVDHSRQSSLGRHKDTVLPKTNLKNSTKTKKQTTLQKKLELNCTLKRQCAQNVLMRSWMT